MTAPDWPEPTGRPASPVHPVPVESVADPARADTVGPSSSDQIAARHLHPLSPLVNGLFGLLRAWPLLFLAAARAAWLPLLVFAVVLVAWRAVEWTRTTYGIGSEGLVVRSGVFWRNIQAVPPQRVQQVEVRRQLRHRAAGLAVVRVGLAGGGSSEVALDALSETDAEHLAAILERWRVEARGESMVAGSAPTADPSAVAPTDGRAPPWPPPPRPPLLQLTTGQLVIAGLTSRSLWLAPFAALAAFVQFMSDTRFAVDTTETVRSSLASASPALTLVSLMVIGLVVAVVGTVLSHHGLTVTEVDRDLVVRRGLFDQRTVTIPRDRVQFVELKAHLVRRRLHLASFDVRTADLGGQGSDGNASTSIPIGARDDLEALVPELIRDVRFPVTHRHPPAAVRRAVIRRCLRLVPVTAAFGALVGGAGVAPMAALIGLAVAVPTGWMAGRRLRSGWTDTCVITERGVFAWQRSVVPVRRIQSIGVEQNPFQRRLGLATARLDVAGSVSGVELRDLALDEALALPELIGTPIGAPIGTPFDPPLDQAVPADR